MRVLCAYSGLEFNVQYFPGTLYDASDTHPIFHLSQKKLIGYTAKWAGRELTETDTYLLYLALLNSTDLIKWRVPAIQTKSGMAHIEQTMESLIRIIGKINVVQSPSLVLPSFVISTETRYLTNCQYWILTWEDALQAWHDGYRSITIAEKLRNREAALEKLIKNSQKKVESYANILADWAAIAGDFPESTTLVGQNQISLREYWKTIIRAAASDLAILSIPTDDIRELLDHCRAYVENGTIFSHTLFNFLERALDKQRNPFGLGETTFRILDARSSVEDANKLAMIDSAPKAEPRQGDYKNKFEFLKARLSYQQAQIYFQKLKENEDKAKDKK